LKLADLLFEPNEPVFELGGFYQVSSFGAQFARRFVWGTLRARHSILPCLWAIIVAGAPDARKVVKPIDHALCGWCT
jgi:hypothetical protein